MINTKADKLLRSLIDAGLSLTEFTILTTKILRIQYELKLDNEDRRQRDHQRQQTRLREQYQFEQQLKDEEQRKIEGQNKLRQFKQTTNEDNSSINFNQFNENLHQIKNNSFSLNYFQQMKYLKYKQKNCYLIFNIDYDLRRNQQTLERTCKRAKRNIYELRAERFNRPDSRSILSVETITLHNKLKETIREINKLFDESKFEQDKRFLQELITYINQYEGDIDLLMCQMQYEPKVKETILFSPVTTDILDRMNLILHQVRTIAQQISTIDDYTDETINDENQLLNLPIKVTYVIKIKTNDQIISSLTDETNVNMKIYGTYNKSPEIRLIQSINKIKWQSGQIDLFNIELNYLGDIYAIEIWHDGQYSSWKVDWIEIIDDAANIYRFPVDRIFDKYSDEKKIRFIIQRDIGPVNRLPIKPAKQIKSYHQIGFVTYTIQVKTGKKPNKATDSLIFIQIKGENGSFSDELCSANSAFKSSVFEPDQLDTFYVVWPNLSKLNSLHLLIQSKGTHPAWFCEYIIVEDGETGEKYKFIVNQLLDGSNPADSNLKRYITVTPEHTGQENIKEEKDKPGYIMRIKTGEKGLSNQSILPLINVIFQGDKEKSDVYPLKSSNNQRNLFQSNQIDEFVISSKYYIGSIKNIQISSENLLEQWFIDNIIIRDISQGKDYIFPLYKWFPNTQQGINNLIIQPINERKAIYKVYCRTIASELKGPDRSIKMTIQGSKGKQDVQLDNPISMANTFQPGRKDEFYLEDIPLLGDLQSIQIDITHPNIKKLGLDFIEIIDLTTKDSYRFNINRMLDSKHSKMTSKAEIIPRSVVNSTTIKTDLKSSTSTNRPNFDQLITNVPQGAKRSEKSSKIPIKMDEDFEEKTFSTTDYSSDIDQINKFNINKKIFSKELINNSEQSIVNQDEKTDSFIINQTENIDRSKSKNENLNHSNSDEFFHRNNEKNSHLQYISDELSNSEKESFPLIKSIKSHSNTDIHQQIPTEFSFSTMTIKKLPYSNVIETEEEEEEQEFSYPSQTITSSTLENLSNELNFHLEKNLNRQIRPGDRVKNNIKKQIQSYQPKEKTNLPKMKSSQSLKQQKISNHLQNSDHQFEQRSSKLDKEQRKFEENPKAITRISSDTKPFSTVDSKQMNIISDIIIASKNRIPSNISQLSKPIIRPEIQSPSSSTSIDISKNQIQNISPAPLLSNVTSSTISNDQSTADIHQSSQQINQTSIDPLIKQNTSHRLQANFDEYHSNENTNPIAMNIITTKSESDIHSNQKSIDDHNSDHSLDKKLFLSPKHAKKFQINSTLTNPKYLDKETSEIQYASLPITSRSIDLKIFENSKEKQNNFQDQTLIDESLTTKSYEINSKQSSINSKSTLKSPSTKQTDIEHMSTVYEESEPSTISLPHINPSLVRQDDQIQFESNSNPVSNEINLSHRRKSKNSSKEKSLSSLLLRSSRGSNHRKKTIDAKTIVTLTSSISSINYEFRLQIGNQSQLDEYLNEVLFIEFINNKNQSIKIPLINSINNLKSFQKGQLDIFHLNIPNYFQNIKKMNLIISRTIKHPLYIHYCELQNLQTMNTFHFPIEKWLGENNLYNIEMNLTQS